METIHARGLEIAFELAGSGPTLVLVHGAGDDHRVWRRQLDGLADAATVVAWDEPGAGVSSDIPAGFGLADWADCLAALVEEVGAPATVCGISWGSTVALELWRRHPALVAALILVDAYAGWQGSLPPAEVAARRDAAAHPPAGAGTELPFPTDMVAGRPSAEHASLLRELAASARPATLRAQAAIMAATDLSAALAAITVPTLLLWGALDVRSPLGVARAFERAPRLLARRHPRLRAPQQPGAARRLQPRGARVLRRLTA